MKFLITFSILLIVPLILFVFLISAVLPLFIQHFFRKKSSGNAVVFPYLTSWEEAA